MIELIVKTKKDINELTKEEMKSINWSSVNNEQFDKIDAEVYKKLNKSGRHFVNKNITDFYSKDIEYWSAVLKNKNTLNNDFINYLVDSITSTNDNSNYNQVPPEFKELLNNNLDVFKKHLNIKNKIKLKLTTFVEYFYDYYLTEEYGDFGEWDMTFHEVLFSVDITDADLLYVKDYDYGSTSVIAELAEKFMIIPDIFVTNEVLRTVGVEIGNLVIKNTRQANHHRRMLDLLRESGYTEDKEHIEWDDAVKYFRDHPAEFELYSSVLAGWFNNELRELPY